MTNARSVAAPALAREVVNSLQNKRKDMDLDYADRIKVTYSAPDGLAEAIEAHREYICGETLATKFERADSLGGGADQSEIDGMEFSFAVER